MIAIAIVALMLALTTAACTGNPLAPQVLRRCFTYDERFDHLQTRVSPNTVQLVETGCHRAPIAGAR